MPLKIEIGKKYETECGQVVKIVRDATGFDLKKFNAPFLAKTVGKYPVTIFYQPDGTQSEIQPAAYRIVKTA